MEAVRDGALEREELIARLEFGGSAFDRRLSRLKHMGVLVPRPTSDDRRRRAYLLAHCGRDLLEIGGDLSKA
jgi:hypothetical protein